MHKLHHLQLLGVPELKDPKGGIVQFRTRKQLALLVYLMLEAQKSPVYREKIVDLLWPDSSTRDGLHSLSQGLSEIRNKLGREALVANRKQVRLEASLLTDIDLDMSEVPARTAGIPLDGLETCSGRGFADWVEVRRDRILRQIRSRLSTELSDARKNGRTAAVHERAKQLYSVDPYNDTAVQALADERFINGDWAGGIRLLRKHIDELETELGRSPSAKVLASVRRFERGLLGDTFSVRPETPEARSVKTRPEAFVGRETELARLEALLCEVENGEFRTCALRGPEGIGKSTLLRRFTVSAATRLLPVYVVNCQEIGQGIPFAAVSDFLHQISRDPSLSGTDPVWLAEASRVSPGIKAAYPGIPEPPVTPPETVRLRLAEAIKSMLEVVADGAPVVLAFDDIHYMDPASRAVLHMLARRMSDTTMLLLATVRCTETELALGGGEGLKGVDWQDLIDVDPLKDTELANLVHSMLRPDETIIEKANAQIVKLAQGNPYLAAMLVADWRHNGPNSMVFADGLSSHTAEHWRPSDTMRKAFERQTQTLSRDALHLLHLLAAAGRAVPTDHVCCLLGIEFTSLNRAALELIERSMVRLEKGSLGIRNQIHRTFVYNATMSEETKRIYHSCLTDFFKATRNERNFQHAFEASHHAVRAGLFKEAIRFVSVGADLAISSGAPREAEAALESVCRKWPGQVTIDVVLLLVRAYSGQGAYERSLQKLRSICLTDVDSTKRALVAYLRAEALHRGRLAHDDDSIIVAADNAMTLANEVGDERLALKTQQIAAEVAHETGRWNALEIIEEECSKLEQDASDTEIRGLATLTLGYCRLISGDPRVAAHIFTHSASLFRRLNQDFKLHRALNGLGMSASSIGRFDKAQDAFNEAAITAARTGDIVAQANAILNLGALSNELGLFAQAAEHFRRAIKLDTEISTSRVSTALYCNAANLSIVLGNFIEANTFLDMATAAAERSQLWQHFVSVRLTRADLSLAQGDVDGARAHVKEALIETGDRHRLVPDLGQYWRLRRHHYSTTGRGDARAIGSPRFITVAHLLELQAFEEWDTNERTTGTVLGSALTELARLSLFGVLARLAAVGMRYGPLESTASDLSGAMAVAGAFPDRPWGAIPSSVLDQQGSECADSAGCM